MLPVVGTVIKKKSIFVCFDSSAFHQAFHPEQNDSVRGDSRSVWGWN